jgi:hypothetical protein
VRQFTISAFPSGLRASALSFSSSIPVLPIFLRSSLFQ